MELLIPSLIPWWLLGFCILEKKRIEGPLRELASFSLTGLILYPLLWPLSMAVDLLMVKAGYSHFSKREREAMEWREKQEAENKAVIEERNRKIESVFGANAVVVVDLKPLGEIDTNGNRVTARSELGIIERGEEVLVSSHNGLEYIVRLRDAT